MVVRVEVSAITINWYTCSRYWLSISRKNAIYASCIALFRIITFAVTHVLVNTPLFQNFILQMIGQLVFRCLGMVERTFRSESLIISMLTPSLVSAPSSYSPL